MIRRWLSNPAVQDWWGTAAGAEAQITLAMDSAAALPRIIQVGCTCIGYAHAVEAGQWAERLREGVPAGAWEVDYFLAPSKGDRAHDGSAVLTLLTAEVFTTTLAVACCSVISIRNEAAARAYEGAGFRWLRVLQDPLLGASWLMLKERPEPRPAR